MGYEDAARFLRNRSDVTKFVWAIAIGWVVFGTFAPPTDLFDIYRQIGFGVAILFALVVTTVWEWVGSKKNHLKA